jgi:proteic killer suppression protein
VIKSFRCVETRRFFETGRSKRFSSIATVATRKLAMLDAAHTLEFLRSLPGNRLEALRGNRKGRYNIRINDVVRGRRGVSADTAMRLARYFGGDARSWLNLQAAYDLRVAEIANGKRIAREISPLAA